MVKMPWNRNRNRPVASNIPQEVEEYYQSAHKQRRGIAGLLTLATLILTLVLAVAIFFGGRWVVNKVLRKDNNSSNTSLQDNLPGDSGSSSPTQKLPDSDTNEGQNNDSSAGGSSNNDQSHQNSNQGSGESGSSQSAPPAPRTPTTGPETPEAPAPQIPKTGPDGEE